MIDNGNNTNRISVRGLSIFGGIAIYNKVPVCECECKCMYS